MDNIPERETNKEQRRGIAPFAGGIDSQGENRGVIYIKYKEFTLGDLGKFFMRLERPCNEEKLEERTYVDEQGITIDIGGRIEKGNLRDFYRRGYYNVALEENTINELLNSGTLQLQDLPDTKPYKVSLYIDNTATIISSLLEDDGGSIFMERDEENRWQHLVLPNNPEILQAIRINISTQQETHLDPNPG